MARSSKTKGLYIAAGGYGNLEEDSLCIELRRCFNPGCSCKLQPACQPDGPDETIFGWWCYDCDEWFSVRDTETQEWLLHLAVYGVAMQL